MRRAESFISPQKKKRVCWVVFFFPHKKKRTPRGVLLPILMKKKLLYIYFISLLGFCVLIASNTTAHYPILEDCFIVLFGILGTQAFF